MWKIVHSEFGFQILKTRYCNQNPIENFFGQIRSHAVRNINPTPRQFQDSFITLLLSNMKSVSIIHGNCETAKESFMLFSLEKCLKGDLVNAEVCDVVRNNSDDDKPHEMFSDIVVCEESSLAYFSEHLSEIIVAITKKLNDCEECHESLRNSEFPIVAKQININVDWHKCMEHHNNIFKTIVRAIAVNILTWWCKQKNNLIHSANDDFSDLLHVENIKKIRKEREAYKLEKEY
ncbi:Uncharacterized protein DBV15_11885, partial [Temnothorax longispinosus]